MCAKNAVMGAFNQGLTPTIACFNQANTPLGVDLDTLITAMQAYVDSYVSPVWGTPAKLTKSTDFVKGAWAMVFLDTADQPGALAYHDLTPEGLPLAKVFVKTTLDNHDQLSVAASHELVEMLVDPAINMMTTGPDLKTMYAYESGDPVEALSFNVNGIPKSDFVYPAYFEKFRSPGSAQFDQMKQVQKTFQILPGGYQIIFKNGKWSQVFGSAAKKKNFAKEDRRGHRSETRKLGKLLRTSEKEIARYRLRTTRGAKMAVVTFEQTIKPYFTTCYREHMMFFCDLWLASDCKTNWQDIHDSVSDGSMPKEGCPEGIWDQNKQAKFLSDFQAWKDGGFQ